MKHISYIIILAILSSTPLECMHKICPHQNQTKTLYVTKKSLLTENPHVLTRLLDESPDTTFLKSYRGITNKKAFSCFVRNIFFNLKPSDIPLEHCELCFDNDQYFNDSGTEAENINEEIERIMRKTSDFNKVINKVAPIFKDKNITQQLIALYHLQKKIPTPGNDIRMRGFIISMCSFMSWMLLPIFMRAQETDFDQLKILCYAALSAWSVVALFIAGESFFYNDTQLAMKQRVIDHFIQEIRHSIRPNYQDDSFKEIIRSGDYNPVFSFK